MGKQKNIPQYADPLADGFRQAYAEWEASQKNKPAQAQTQEPEYNPARFRYDQPTTTQAIQEGIKRGELVRDNDNRVFRTRPKKDNPKEREQEKEALYNIKQDKGGETVSPRVYGNVEEAANPEMEFNRIAAGEQGDDGFIEGAKSIFQKIAQYLPSQMVLPTTTPIPITNPQAIRKQAVEARGKTYLPRTEPRGVMGTIGEMAGALGVGATAMLAAPEGAAGAVLGMGLANAIPEGVEQYGRVQRGESSLMEGIGRTLVSGAAGAAQGGIVPKVAGGLVRSSAPLQKKLLDIASKQGQMVGAQALRSMGAVAKAGGIKGAAKVIGGNTAVAAAQSVANAGVEGLTDSTPDDPVRKAMAGDYAPLAKEIGLETAMGTGMGLAFAPLDVNASTLLKSLPKTRELLQAKPEQIVDAAATNVARETAQQEAQRQAAQVVQEQAAIAARTFNPEEFPVALKSAASFSKLQKQAGVDPRIKQGARLVDQTFFGGEKATANLTMTPEAFESALSLARETGADVENTNAEDIAKHLVNVASGTKPLDYVQKVGTPVFDRISNSTLAPTPLEKQVAKQEIGTFIQSFVPNPDDKQALIKLLSPANKRDLSSLNPVQLDQQLTKAFTENKGTKQVFETLFKPQETAQVTPEVTPPTLEPPKEIVLPQEPVIATPILSTNVQDHPKPDIANPVADPTDNVAPKMAYLPERVTAKDVARLTKSLDFTSEMVGRGIEPGSPEFAAMQAKREKLDKQSKIGNIFGGDITRVQLHQMGDNPLALQLGKTGRLAERVAGKALGKIDEGRKFIEKKYGKLRQHDNHVLNAASQANFKQFKQYLDIKNDPRLNDVQREQAFARVLSDENIAANVREAAAAFGLDDAQAARVREAYDLNRKNFDDAAELQYLGKWVRATGLMPDEIPARVELARQRVAELEGLIEKGIASEESLRKELNKLDKTIAAKSQLGEATDAELATKRELEEEMQRRVSLDKVRNDLREEKNILAWADGKDEWVKESARSAYFDQWSTRRSSYRVRVSVPAEKSPTGKEINLNYFVDGELFRDKKANAKIAELVNEGVITPQHIADGYVRKEELPGISPTVYERAEDIVQKALRLYAPEMRMKQAGVAKAKQSIEDSARAGTFSPEEEAALLNEINAFLENEGMKTTDLDLFEGEDIDGDKVLAVQRLKSILEGSTIDRGALVELLRQSAQAPVPKRTNKGVGGWEPEPHLSWEFMQNALDAQVSSARADIVRGAMLGDIGRQQRMFDDVALRNKYTDFLERKAMQLRGGANVFEAGRVSRALGKTLNKAGGTSSVAQLAFQVKSPLKNALEGLTAGTVNLIMNGHDLSPSGILRAYNKDVGAIVKRVMDNLKETAVIDNLSTDFLKGDTLTGRRWEAKARSASLYLQRMSEKLTNRTVPTQLYLGGRVQKLIDSGHLDLSDSKSVDGLIESLTEDGHRFIQEISGEFSKEFRAVPLKNLVKASNNPVAQAFGNFFLALKKPQLNAITLYSRALNRTVMGVERATQEGDVKRARDLSGLLGVAIFGGGLMGFKYLPGMKDVVALAEKVQEEVTGRADKASRMTTASLAEETDMAWQKIKSAFPEDAHETLDYMKDIFTDGLATKISGYNFSSENSLYDLVMEVSPVAQVGRAIKAGSETAAKPTPEGLVKIVSALVPVAGKVGGLVLDINRGYELDNSGAPKQAKGGEGTSPVRLGFNAAFGQRLEDKRANDAQRLDRVPLETALQRRDFAQSLLRVQGVETGSDYAKSEIVRRVEKDAKPIRAEIYRAFNSPEVAKLVKESTQKMKEFLATQEGTDYKMKSAGYEALAGERREGTDKQFKYIEKNALQAIKDYYLSEIVAKALTKYDERVQSKLSGEVYRGTDGNDPNYGQYIESFPPEERGFRYAITKMSKRGETDSKRRLERYIPTVEEED